VVHDLGSAVSRFKKGDPVLINCISSCSTCKYCKRAMPSHCLNGGWLLGHLVDGTQAEYVRIPLADAGLHHVPEGVNDKHLVMLSDILPTGLEVGVLKGKVQPGQSVAVVGVGPVGLAAIMGAKLYSPSLIVAIDKDPTRLKAAKKIGADHVVNPSEADPKEAIMGLTDNVGADTVIEAVGVPATLEMAQDLVAPGGVIANIGVHGKSCTLKIEKLWGHNVSLTTGLVDTVSTPTLLRLFSAGSLPAGELITHGRCRLDREFVSLLTGTAEYPFRDMETAYTTFKAASENSALKMLISM
jgi:alcohol dehydrogenase